MVLHVLHDKPVILDYLQKEPGLQVYSIGDLDDFFWPRTTWYALKDNDAIQSLALLYAGQDIPTLLCFYKGDVKFSYRLLERIKSLLPVTFYAHLSPGLLDVFGRHNIIKYYGSNYKMVLTKAAHAEDDKNIKRLSVQDLPVMKDFLVVAYPQNWFDSQMLETNKYYGYFIDNKLVGVAGVHVYSKEYKVAAIGNVATHPDYRGQQIGCTLTAALCFDLQKSVSSIGLNVKTDNEHAIKCYKKIGFEIIGTFDECYIKNNCT
jgi:ribosomal protein S18 acetylase RimI-like enzyme